MASELQLFNKNSQNVHLTNNNILPDSTSYKSLKNNPLSRDPRRKSQQVTNVAVLNHHDVNDRQPSFRPLFGPGVSTFENAYDNNNFISTEPSYIGNMGAHRAEFSYVGNVGAHRDQFFLNTSVSPQVGPHIYPCYDGNVIPNPYRSRQSMLSDPTLPFESSMIYDRGGSQRQPFSGQRPSQGNSVMSNKREIYFNLMDSQQFRYDNPSHFRRAASPYAECEAEKNMSYNRNHNNFQMSNSSQYHNRSAFYHRNFKSNETVTNFYNQQGNHYSEPTYKNQQKKSKMTKKLSTRDQRNLKLLSWKRSKRVTKRKWGKPPKTTLGQLNLNFNEEEKSSDSEHRPSAEEKNKKSIEVNESKFSSVVDASVFCLDEHVQSIESHMVHDVINNPIAISNDNLLEEKERNSHENPQNAMPNTQLSVNLDNKHQGPNDSSSELTCCAENDEDEFSAKNKSDDMGHNSLKINKEPSSSGTLHLDQSFVTPETVEKCSGVVSTNFNKSDVDTTTPKIKIMKQVELLEDLIGIRTPNKIRKVTEILYTSEVKRNVKDVLQESGIGDTNDPAEIAVSNQLKSFENECDETCGLQKLQLRKEQNNENDNQKPKRKRKNELDKLHDYINKYHDSEAIIAASGSRQCRFQKVKYHLSENKPNQNTKNKPKKKIYDGFDESKFSHEDDLSRKESDKVEEENDISSDSNTNEDIITSSDAAGRTKETTMSISNSDTRYNSNSPVTSRVDKLKSKSTTPIILKKKHISSQKDPVILNQLIKNNIQSNLTGDLSHSSLTQETVKEHEVEDNVPASRQLQTIDQEKDNESYIDDEEISELLLDLKKFLVADPEKCVTRKPPSFQEPVPKPSPVLPRLRKKHFRGGKLSGTDVEKTLQTPAIEVSGCEEANNHPLPSLLHAPNEDEPSSLVVPQEHKKAKRICGPKLGNKFSPQEIDIIPRVAIFRNPLGCQLCPYETKIRRYLIRHIQQHSSRDTVPQKTEKMIDKIMNLAGSSHKKKIGPEFSEDETLGERPFNYDSDQHLSGLPLTFVYCHVEECGYRTLSETMLKDHISVIHKEENYYVRSIERQTEVVHNGGQVDVQMRLYKPDQTFEQPAQKSYFTDRSDEQGDKWFCCNQCLFKTNEKKSILQHGVIEHKMAMPYMCSKCGYGSDNEQILINHCYISHPEDEVYVISLYEKVTEESNSTQPVIELDDNGDAPPTTATAPTGIDGLDLLELKFGHFGSPLNNSFMCPRCLTDFVCKSYKEMKEHLYKDFKYTPIVCKICNSGSTMRDKIMEHVNKYHNIEWVHILEYIEVKANKEFECWVGKLLLRQKSLMNEMPAIEENREQIRLSETPTVTSPQATTHPLSDETSPPEVTDTIAFNSDEDGEREK